MPERRYTVYLLRCADGSLYAGITDDLARRLATHNAGKGAKYTRARLPVEIAWKRGQQLPRHARQLEYALKALRRADKERLVAGDLALWRRLRRLAVTPL
ncbi:GIY-YIG nuclease family protein [Nannocystis pusilla]|uniref:GIY-YIG nuclease family protein n=1 Tax=Nannocystis pusilla TaxID=889268 RepID=UPI003DA699A3